MSGTFGPLNCLNEMQNNLTCNIQINNFAMNGSFSAYFSPLKQDLNHKRSNLMANVRTLLTSYAAELS